MTNRRDLEFECIRDLDLFKKNFFILLKKGLFAGIAAVVRVALE